MTFSVDVDVWSLKAGPAQDATPRQSASEGRGKDFAGSLLAVLPEIGTEPLMPTDAASQAPPLTLASLNFMAAPPPVAGTPTAHPIEPPLPSDAEPAETLPANLPRISERPPLQAEDTAASAISASEPAPAPDLSDLSPGAAGREPAPRAPDTPDARSESNPPHEEQDLNAQATSLSGEPPSVPHGIAGPVASPQSQSQVAPMAAVSIMPTQAAGSKPRTETLSASAQTPAQANAAGPSASGRVDQASQPGPDPLAQALVDAASAAGPESGSDQTPNHPVTDTSVPQTTTSPATPAVSGPAQPVVQAQTSTPLQPVSAALVATATPAQLPEILAHATAAPGDDRVMIQLDPPELGRISLDFKFDAQGLQHVTVTAESPEAMRQLRLMHFELVQALERNGLSGQNMSFQHQNPQQQSPWGDQARISGARFDTPSLTGDGLVIAADASHGRHVAANGRLDIRL